MVMAGKFLPDFVEVGQLMNFWPFGWMWRSQGSHNKCQLFNVSIALSSELLINVNGWLYKGSPEAFSICWEMWINCAICVGNCLTGNSGTPLSISAKTQPTAHMSTGGPYLWLPQRSSGARYHLLATCGEKHTPASSSAVFRAIKSLARPKSAIFSRPLSSISRLAGLMS